MCKSSKVENVHVTFTYPLERAHWNELADNEEIIPKSEAC